MKWLAGLGGVVIALVALIGFAHTPSGHFLLPYLWLGGKCPVGGDMKPEARDAVRAQVLAPAAGTVPAHARPAMGFTLAVTTAAEITAWEAAHSLTCPQDVGTTRCENVPANALDAAAAAYGSARQAQEVRFGFDAAGLLISVDVHYDLTDSTDAIALYQSISDALMAAAGPVTTERGLGTVEHIDHGPLQQDRREYDFADYRATVTLTNQGHGRYVLRETFQDVPKTGPVPLAGAVQPPSQTETR